MFFQVYEILEFEALKQVIKLQAHKEELVKRRTVAVAQRRVRRARAASLREELDRFLHGGNEQLRMLQAEIESITAIVKQVSVRTGVHRSRRIS